MLGERLFDFLLLDDGSVVGLPADKVTDILTVQLNAAAVRLMAPDHEIEDVFQ